MKSGITSPGLKNAVGGVPVARGGRGGDFLEIFFREAHAAFLDFSVGRDQKYGGNIGDAVLIGDGVAVFINQRGKFGFKFLAEFARVPRRRPAKFPRA